MQTQMESMEEVEVISSPPLEEVEIFETQQEESQEQDQERPVTPVTLGGSRFRRKPAPPSPPLETDLRISNSARFDSQEDMQSAGFIMPPSLGKYDTSNTEVRTGGREYLTARTSSGKVISISKKPNWKKHIKKQEQVTAARELKQNYYGVDIHRLLDNIEDTTSRPSPTYCSLSPTTQVLSMWSDSSVDAPIGKVGKELWTDKYRAKKFMDLLGDERIHRDIMRWIKHWDYCVFGRDIPKSSSYHSTYHPSNINAHNAANKGKLTTFGGTTFGGVQTPDPYQRPTQRILMLHGPPGLGKTTLAHVAATLAGYEVLEINASDDRSGSAARDKIVEAVETVGIDRNGRRGKERCVILDECDGGDQVSSFILRALIIPPALVI